jgi:hypothetical protein
MVCRGAGAQGVEFPLLLEVARERGLKVVVSFDVLETKRNLAVPFDDHEDTSNIVWYLSSIGETCVVVRPGVLSNQPSNTFGEVTADTQKYFDSLQRSTPNQARATIDLRFRHAPVEDVFTLIGEVVGAVFDCSDVRGDSVWIETVASLPKEDIVRVLEALCVLGNYSLEAGGGSKTVVRRSGQVWRQFMVIRRKGGPNAGSGSSRVEVRWLRGPPVRPRSPPHREAVTEDTGP